MNLAAIEIEVGWVERHRSVTQQRLPHTLFVYVGHVPPLNLTGPYLHPFLLPPAKIISPFFPVTLVLIITLE